MKLTLANKTEHVQPQIIHWEIVWIVYLEEILKLVKHSLKIWPKTKNVKMVIFSKILTNSGDAEILTL